MFRCLRQVLAPGQWVAIGYVPDMTATALFVAGQGQPGRLTLTLAATRRERASLGSPDAKP